MDPVNLIWQDISGLASEAGGFGWAIIAMVTCLPLAAAGAVAAGSRLALVPLLGSVSLWALWYVYYATDWLTNPGLMGVAYGFYLLLAGWAVLLVAIIRLRRARSEGPSSTPPPD